ncbi:hypothetical protein L9G15_18170 [Shewanella sp. A3A]|nr:hypothetical protein [Shewanella ferrihydritica]
MSSKATHFLFKFVIFSAITFPALAGELVHGPLELPDHENELGFYQQADKLTAYINGEQGQQLDSYPSGTEVVAVFYQDLDGDHHREVLVMLNTPEGKALRAYGDSNGFEWQPLQRAQTKLNGMVPTLKSFTVAAVRNALKQWPLQDFTTRYELPQDADDNVKAALNGNLAMQAQFSGYLDKNGHATANVDDAVAYRLQYPAQISANGQQYALVAHYEREFFGQQDPAPFQLTSIGYEQQGKLQGTQWQYMQSSPSFAAVVVRAAYDNGKLHGHYVNMSPRNGAIEVEGDYQNGQRVGEWLEAYSYDRYWKGQYQDGQRAGKWLLYSYHTEDLMGEASYTNGKLNGHYETWQITDVEPDASGKIPKRLEQKGQYVNDKKQGEWLSSLWDSQEVVHYQDGLKHGERLVTGNDGVVREREQYVDDALEGEASYYRDDGSLKQVKYFHHGQLDGAELSFNKYGKLYQQRNFRAFKDGTGTWVSQQHGLSVRYDGERLQEVEHYQYGEKVGQQLTFDKHSGQLKELHNYVLKDSRTDVEMHGRQIWFKPQAPHGIATVADYQHGQKAGMEYHFADDKHIDEITHYCTEADGEQCRAGARFGWRYTYFANGMSQCIEHYTASGLVEYNCNRSDGSLDKTREVVNGEQMIDRSYFAGVVSREEVFKTQAMKTINGQQVPDFNQRRKDGVSTNYYPSGKPHWQLLYRDGKQVCGKEFDQQGQQTAATASCKFPLALR